MASKDLTNVYIEYRSAAIIRKRNSSGGKKVKPFGTFDFFVIFSEATFVFSLSEYSKMQQPQFISIKMIRYKWC